MKRPQRRSTPLLPWRWRLYAPWRIRSEIGSRSARGFNRSLHVSNERLKPDHSLLYIGQTLVEVSATVIAQQNGDGSLHMLAAFANDGMSLRRHVETVVKPWISADARWALHDSRLLLGAFEEIDGRTEWDLLQTVEDIIGGSWEKPETRWEAQRDAVLELIGKATPGSFRPALQIDATDARLLVEALSGRWSYEAERREKRTLWHYVANAFSLLVSTLRTAGNRDEDIRVITNWGTIVGQED